MDRIKNLGAVIFLQGYWFFIILIASKQLAGFQSLILTLVISFSLYYFLFPNIRLRKFLFITAFSTFWGYAQDSLLIKNNLFPFSSPPLWLLCLWVIFPHYLELIPKTLRDKNISIQAFMGAAGGASSYYFGSSLYGIDVQDKIFFCSIVGISWAIYFPLVIELYHSRSLLNKILDYSIIFNFDKSGFLRRSINFSPLSHIDGKNVFVTGGTSGIGLEVVKCLKEQRGHISFCGRNREAGEKIARLSHSHFYQCDIADWEKLPSLVEKLPSLDIVILNAGAMPKEKSENSFGYELQGASQLFGHYLLIELLRRTGKLNNQARIIWVSSGGMYLKKLDVTALKSVENYDKVDTYANVKRAQVTLCEELGKSDIWNNYQIVSMHPGWVATPGLEESLPSFYNFLKKLLRNNREGADTINWLATTTKELSSGGFYFDRQIVSPYLLKSYSPTLQQRKDLIQMVENILKLAKVSAT